MSFSDMRVQKLFDIAWDTRNGLEIRVEAVKSLGKLSASGIKDAVEALADLANSDRHDDVRREAVRQLARTE